MTEDFANTSSRKFSRYVEMVNVVGVKNLFKNISGNEIRLDVEATITRLTKFIPELALLTESLITENADNSSQQAPTCPLSLKARKHSSKGAELLRERSLHLQSQLDSNMATHFQFFASISLEREQDLQSLKQVIAEPDTHEKWRFPQNKWGVDKILTGVVLAEFDASTSYSFDFLLTDVGYKDFEILRNDLAKTTKSDQRIELQTGYRNILLQQGVGKNRDMRLPTRNELIRIGSSLLRINKNILKDNSLLDQYIARDDNGDIRFDEFGIPIILTTEFTRYVAQEADTSVNLADSVVRAMTWGAREEVHYDLEFLLERLQDESTIDEIVKYYLNGILLHLNRAPETEELTKLCDELRHYYLSSTTELSPISSDALTLQFDETTSSRVAEFASKEANRIFSLYSGYLKKIQLGFGKNHPAIKSVQEYLNQLSNNVNIDSIQDVVRRDIIDFLASR